MSDTESKPVLPPDPAIVAWFAAAGIPVDMAVFTYELDHGFHPGEAVETSARRMSLLYDGSLIDLLRGETGGRLEINGDLPASTRVVVYSVSENKSSEV